MRPSTALWIAIGIGTGTGIPGAYGQTYRVTYDVRFQTAGEQQVLRGTAALDAASDQPLNTQDWNAVLRLVPVDCDTYRLELEALYGSQARASIDLRPRLLGSGSGRYGAPLTLTAERAGLAMDAAFAVRRPDHPDAGCR